MQNKTDRRGSWEGASKWYKGIVAKKGHYYHEHVVLPGVVRLLDLKPGDSVIDLACGNGVLARALPANVAYCGYEISPTLIQDAKRLTPQKGRAFYEADVTKDLQLKPTFTKGAIMLALQNMAHPEGALKNLSTALKPGGMAVIVINHPCFRIPRQSAWGIDPQTKTQYRRIDRYLSRLEIPVTIHPGQQHSPVTWDYHFSVSDLSGMIATAGLVIQSIEEWISDKQSVGSAAKMENRSRQEFPLFMAIKLLKL